MRNETPNLTERLNAYKSAGPDERSQLWEDIFPSLKQLARSSINAVGVHGRERPTELVIAQYEGIDKALGRQDASWENRRRFFAYAALAMRRHLVRRARQGASEELLDENRMAIDWSPTLILALDQALDVVKDQFPRHTQAFMLRYYLGHSHEEIMEIMSDAYNTKALLASDLTVVRKALVKLLDADGA
jgi:DNA-directed RNA polymerase specialized sigma24 family protein